jgi:cytochrome P450
MGNQLFVVISDPIVAKDLLVNNGAIFSGRKKSFIKSQSILNGRAITGSGYDDTWRKHRRIAANFLSAKAMDRYNNVLDFESLVMVRSMYVETLQGELPLQPANYAGRYSLNNMLTMSFAMRTGSTHDPLVEKALQLALEYNELTGSMSNMVDFIEPLQWLPTRTRSRAVKLHDDFIEVYGALIMQVQDRMTGGEDVPDCIAKTLLETREEQGLDWEDICMLGAVFTLGGVHSTASIIQWFLALIPSFPDIQARAHAELDRVVGQGNLPTAADEARLPYIRAIIKEVQRCYAPFWLGTPHCSTEDFVYKGMFIPKDTVMVMNAYTMHHNAERYPDPHQFNPERYLGDDLSCAESTKLGDPLKRDHWTFGAGRRICPGILAAERVIWLGISRILWCYEIQAIPGEPIDLTEYEGLSGRSPVPFRVKLIPRHGKVLDVLGAE